MANRTGRCFLCGSPSNPNGIGGELERCAECKLKARRTARAKWSAKNKEREAKMKADYAVKNRDKILASKSAAYRRDPVKHRAWALANKDRMTLHQRRSHLRRKFGITVEQFDAALAAQGGRCAICDTDNPGTRTWHVDHCHETKRVRGLLCKSCNHGLGLFRDNPGTLLAAERYLQSHRSHRPPVSPSPSGAGGHFSEAH